jgi:hypothetical protein
MSLEKDAEQMRQPCTKHHRTERGLAELRVLGFNLTPLKLLC